MLRLMLTLRIADAMVWLVLLRIFNLLTLRISDAVIVVTVAVSVVFLFSVSFIITGVIVIIASVIMSPPIGKGGQ